MKKLITIVEFWIGVNVSFEGKKGNQTTANYLKIGSQDYILVGKNWKVFDWKR